MEFLVKLRVAILITLMVPYAIYFQLKIFVSKIFRILFKRNRKKTVIVIYSRYPTEGVTKTRLIPLTGKKGASQVQRFMIEEVLNKLVSIQDLCDIEVEYNGGSNQLMQYWLGTMRTKFTHKFGLSWTPHQGKNLSEMVSNTINRHILRNNYDRIIITAGDVPDINPSIIKETISLLPARNLKSKTTSNCFGDMVLGPAKDGGYFLVGMNHLDALSRLSHELFVNIPWGTETVFFEQKQIAEKLNVNVHVLPTVLSDVDHPSDIKTFESATQITKEEITDPFLSVIIPTFNEEKTIVKTVENVFQRCSRPERLEVVVADGGSNDGTREEVQSLQKNNLYRKIRLLEKNSDLNKKLGRGDNLCNGAIAASGSHFLFLHADTILPQDFDMQALGLLDIPGNVAGAFRFSLDVLHDQYKHERSPKLIGLNCKLFSILPI